MLCLDSGDSHFSSIQSQTVPLFTRGIIQHMATVCLWCQVAHKEWLHCLLREMVANCCSLSWLSAIRGHRDLAGVEFALRNQKEIVARMVQRHQNKPRDASTSDKHIIWCSIEQICCIFDALGVIHNQTLIWNPRHTDYKHAQDCILSLI